MRLPTFMILGAAKCGTTSLAEFLSQHPDICMSSPKEPYFFEAEFELGPKYYWDTYFSNYSGEREIGDARHRNLFLPSVPKRINKLLPDAKFLVIVRHPVERAYSHWWHSHSRGQEQNGFDIAIERNFKRLQEGPHFVTQEEIELYEETLDKAAGYSPFETYIDSGHYAEQIKRYHDLFGHDRVKILFFENLVADPQKMLADIFAFLKVDSIRISDTTKRNQSLSSQNQKIINALRKIPGKEFFPTSTRQGIRNIIGSFFFPHKPEIPQNVRIRLLDHFEPHTKQLEEMTDRDLAHWRT